LQLSDNVLERVAIAAGHADEVTLNGSLYLGFTVLDELNDLFGFLLRATFLDRSALSHRTTRRRLDLAVAECFQGHATADEFLLQDVVHVAQLRIVFGSEHELILLVHDGGRAALEVETLAHLFDSLIKSVCNLC